MIEFLIISVLSIMGQTHTVSDIPLEGHQFLQFQEQKVFTEFTSEDMIIVCQEDKRVCLASMKGVEAVIVLNKREH